MHRERIEEFVREDDATEGGRQTAFEIDGKVAGTGVWNFNAERKSDVLTITGTAGTIETAVFADVDLVVVRDGQREVLPIRNPLHVHQPLIQSIVDELRGGPPCPSTGESGARASWVIDRCR